jgi:type IV fimbrial biogenesis protein FimT
VLSIERASGFSLIELLVTISIAAVLLGLGAPAMSTYLQNAKVGSAAQAFQAAVQMARTEAIRRNVAAEFAMTAASAAASGVVNAAADPAGRTWLVRAPTPASSGVPAGVDLIDAKSGLEGEAGATQGVRLRVFPNTFTGAIAFNGFGGTADGSAYTADLDNPNAGSCLHLGGSIHCRRIRILAGGQIQSCDPGVAMTDNRHCPAGTPAWVP